MLSRSRQTKRPAARRESSNRHVHNSLKFLHCRLWFAMSWPRDRSPALSPKILCTCFPRVLSRRVLCGANSGARSELDSTLYPFSSRDSISHLNPQLPVALRTANWHQVIELSQASDAPPSKPNPRFLARELAVFPAGMQAAEARDVAKAEASSTQFDAELWRMSQRFEDAQGLEHGMAAARSDSAKGSPKIPVMSDAYIEPLMRMLSVMSLELRGSVLTVEGRPPRPGRCLPKRPAMRRRLNSTSPLSTSGPWAKAKRPH